ncbi:MAG TPA: LysR family transcriptional regulator, partial [Alphaproteobacteria bacterium]|nr:LysR family transcriptional regulator [Alphaproteobacteria bacterium]
MRGDHSIDFRSLQIFGVVCESASLTEAARRLNMTQPAVSQHIRALERQVGVELIDRRIRPIALTTAGALLRDHGRVLLTDLARLPNLLRQSAQASLPRLRLGFVDSFAAAFGADLIKTMRDRAEHLTLWSGLSPLQHDALQSRDLDVIVATDALDDMDELERHPLFR